MATQSKPYIPLSDYFELEDKSLERHEYLNGEMFLMAGGTLAHSTMIFNIGASLVSQLANADCVVRGSDARIRTSPAGLYSYADVVVSCGKEESENNTLLNPVLIAEVLSESTESYDRGEKFEFYRQIESFREYIIIAQHRVYVEHHLRDEQLATKWTMQIYTDRNAEVALRSIPATLRLFDVYRKALAE